MRFAPSFRAAAACLGLGLPIMLAACSTPETRVRNGLVEAGLSRPMAGCMAERMVDRLSLVQLRRIGRLGDLRDENPRQMTVDQFLRRARALGDPEIWSVMSTSAAICAIDQRG